MTTRTLHVSAVAMAAALVLTSCSDDGNGLTSPDSDASARGRGQTDVPTVSSDADLDPPDTGGTNDAGDPIAYADPIDAVRAFESAYNDRDASALGTILGGAFAFHTHPPLGLPPEFSRSEVISSLDYMLDHPDVQMVSLSMELAPAEPAGDLDHPDWVAVPVVAATLEVTVRSEFGGTDTFIVPGDPARFVLGRGPSLSSQDAGWQIMSQWDLHEADSGARDVPMTWTEVLYYFMDPGDGVTSDDGSSPGL